MTPRQLRRLRKTIRYVTGLDTRPKHMTPWARQLTTDVALHTLTRAHRRRTETTQAAIDHLEQLVRDTITPTSNNEPHVE